MLNTGQPLIADVTAAAYRIPTEAPEADGTFAWDSTTMVVVHIEAAGYVGMGYTYADASVATMIQGRLAGVIRGRDALDIPELWAAMQRQVRNLGRSGLAATAISAVDAALWDLKAKLLDLPLARLLGRRREAVPIYGSGGFTTYSDDRLAEQFAEFVGRDGCRSVKMKIGSDPPRDPDRIMVAKAAITEADKVKRGSGARQLFVDANGAFSAKEALRLADICADADIRWFEEPVTADDLPGLRLVRERAPAAMEVAAGEYIYTLDDARRFLEVGAVDVLQADVTRCGGITGFMQIGALCEAYHLDLSGHCAPAMHRHVACCVPRLRHLEWFHDHVRIEQMLFDGAPTVRDGMIAPDLSRPGHGLTFKHQDAAQFQVRQEAP